MPHKYILPETRDFDSILSNNIFSHKKDIFRRIDHALDIFFEVNRRRTPYKREVSYMDYKYTLELRANKQFTLLQIEYTRFPDGMENRAKTHARELIYLVSNIIDPSKNPCLETPKISQSRSLPKPQSTGSSSNQEMCETGIEENLSGSATSA